MYEYYYQRALQCLAHCLLYPEDKELAKKWLDEENVEKLEAFILKKKSELDAETFYYNAGRACQGVIDEADKECCNETFHACCGGIIKFELFVQKRK